MYGDKTASDERKKVMSAKITYLPFSCTENELAVPHRIRKMKPHMKEVIRENNINLIITASPGNSHYPWNVIDNIPIILINIFGAPTLHLQKNMQKVISISQTVELHVEKWTGKLPQS